MANDETKEPDFYPFRLKDHGWVLKKGVPIESIGNAYKEMVYQLVTKDFETGSVAHAMYEDAVAMMKAKSDKARKAAEARWSQEGTNKPPSPQKQGDTSKKEPMPKLKNIVINWALDNGIDSDDAGECWEATMERGGNDGDGNPVNNWKAFVKSWCSTRESKRRKQG